MDRSKAIGLALVATGVAAIGMGVGYFGPQEAEYHHEVHEIGEDRATEIANELSFSISNYSNLSSEAQNVIDEAQYSGDEVTVNAERNKPKEWDYMDDYHSIILVHDGDKYYKIKIIGENVPTVLSSNFWASFFIGVSLVGVGTWLYRNSAADSGAGVFEIFATTSFVTTLGMMAGGVTGSQLLRVVIVVLALLVVIRGISLTPDS